MKGAGGLNCALLAVARQSRSKRAPYPPPTTLFFVEATCCRLVTSEAVSSEATVANAVKLKLRVAT